MRGVEGPGVGVRGVVDRSGPLGFHGHRLLLASPVAGRTRSQVGTVGGILRRGSGTAGPTAARRPGERAGPCPGEDRRSHQVNRTGGTSASPSAQASAGPGGGAWRRLPRWPPSSAGCSPAGRAATPTRAPVGTPARTRSTPARTRSRPKVIIRATAPYTSWPGLPAHTYVQSSPSTPAPHAAATAIAGARELPGGGCRHLGRPRRRVQETEYVGPGHQRRPVLDPQPAAQPGQVVVDAVDADPHGTRHDRRRGAPATSRRMRASCALSAGCAESASPGRVAPPGPGGRGARSSATRNVTSRGGVSSSGS